MVIDIDDHLDARQMGGQRTPVRSPFGNACLALSRVDLFGFFQA
jgi:hypothetical protein